MAETLTESSVSYSNPIKTKPVVVRVKRKSYQEPLDAFWLEINERPAKKQTLDIERLSISHSDGKGVSEARPTKLLVQHVETIYISEATEEVLQSYLPNLNGSKDLKTRIEERKCLHKQDKLKQPQLRSSARQKHEDIVRSARFEQIWKSRREEIADGDDSLHGICHLYDIVQVDTEENNSRKAQQQRHVSAEERAMLCNYLPLLREYLSTDAQEIESEIKSYVFGEEYANNSRDADVSSSTDYVYDLYTVDVDADIMGDEAKTAYPLVQVDEVDYYDGPSDSEYASDDSNAENNPLNDYPDEISSEDEKDEKQSFASDYESENEDEEADVSEEDDDDDQGEIDWRWKTRK